MKPWSLGGGALALALSVGAHAASGVAPVATVSLPPPPALDPESAVGVSGLSIPLGPATLVVEGGYLVPVRSTAGDVAEIVLVGRARFRVAPSDPIEAGQLELFTGEPALDTPVDGAVLVLQDRDHVRRLLDRPHAGGVPLEVGARAAELHAEWLESPERREIDPEAASFRARIDDAPYGEHFAAWCRGHELGTFLWQLDPGDEEPLTLAAFRPLDVQGWERRALARHLRLQQRKGRWLGTRVRDLGAWDLWLSAPGPPELERGVAGDFEPRHYALDVTIQRDRMRLSGTARIDVDVLRSGRRTLSLDLFRDLAVRGVRDGSGRALEVVRSGEEVVVRLPEPSREGEPLVLEVTWEGRVLQWTAPGTFDLLDTSRWYPHCGSRDHATYDVTLRWPQAYTLVAGGERVGGGREGSERWERRRLDLRTSAYSFVLGRFEEERRQVGGVELRIAFNRSAPIRLSRAVREETMEVAAAALERLEAIFGDYPLDELTLVTLPRNYSQSHLGLVALSDTVLLKPVGAETTSTQRDAAETARWRRRATIAHELAHQWWGNLVVWSSYRDQWLSEALANYAAFLADPSVSADALSALSAGWRASLGEPTEHGRTIESIGPVVLGPRLASSLAPDAYRSIVYRKGAVILSMLSLAMGEREFLGLLRELAAERPTPIVDTESFLARVEKEAGLDLDAFARRFVYGTGIPTIHYDWTSEPTPEGLHLVLQTRVLEAVERRLRVEPLPSGELRIERDPLQAGVARSVPSLPVPYVVLDAQGRPLATGRLDVRDRENVFRLDAPAGASSVVLDPAGQILARLLSARVEPKRALQAMAGDHAIAGDLEAAEERLEAALAAPAESGVGAGLARGPLAGAGASRSLDGRIHLDLARVHVERGSWEAARAALDAAAPLLDRPGHRSYPVERDVLESRIELGRGDARAVYERLRRTLAAAAPRPGRLTWRERSARWQLQGEREALTEAYALFAVAAHRVGEPEDSRWALAYARARGADVRLTP